MKSRNNQRMLKQANDCSLDHVYKASTLGASEVSCMAAASPGCAQRNCVVGLSGDETPFDMCSMGCFSMSADVAAAAAFSAIAPWIF